MSTVKQQLIYELEITAMGPLVEEFTAHGVWVFFHETAPEELAEFALLHRAEAPLRPLQAGQEIEVAGERRRILAVGPVANQNLAALGHMVVKANGEAEAEMPGDVCIEALPLPTPTIGMRLRVWDASSEDGHGII